MELRWSRSTAAFVGFGVVSFRLDRAALCCEATCEVVFDMAPGGRDAGTVVCPGCGGSSWVPLSTIVPSLRVAPPRPSLRRLAVVPPIPADRVPA